MLAVIISKLGLSIFAAPACPGGKFFGFPHWWQFLGSEQGPLGKCQPAFTFPNDILKVGLALVDMLLYLAGIVAVVSVIIVGASLILSNGNVERATSARRRLINAIVGLAIVLAASAVVSFIGNSLT